MSAEFPLDPELQIKVRKLLSREFLFSPASPGGTTARKSIKARPKSLHIRRPLC
jgi:hypothetical protein